MDTSNTTEQQQVKSSIDSLSREELITKYKGLLGIAKKAKQAKDEMAEENRKLKDIISSCDTQKEADKKALLTMKEMLEQFTENKLQMTTQLSELQQKRKKDEEFLSELRIENESLKRQLDRLTQDNDSLLNDIDHMEDQLKQVNLLGVEQKKHLELLELEVNKLKEAESLNASLKSQVHVAHEENKFLKEKENSTLKALEELNMKYQTVKAINSEQRHKFNSLKDRFIEMYRKLKNLKECKRVLLETQYEYAGAVFKWQSDIIRASQLMCKEMNELKNQNDLLENDSERSPKILKQNINIEAIATKVKDMQDLCARACEEKRVMNIHFIELSSENETLKNKLEYLSKDVTDNNLKTKQLNLNTIFTKLNELQSLSDCAYGESQKAKSLLHHLQQENEKLKQESKGTENNTSAITENVETDKLKRDLADLKDKLEVKESEVQALNNKIEKFEEKVKQLAEKESKLLSELAALNQELAKFKEQSMEDKVYLEEMRASCKQKEQDHAELLIKLKEQEMKEQELQKLANELMIMVNTESNVIVPNLEEISLKELQELRARYEQKQCDYFDLMNKIKELEKEKDQELQRLTEELNICKTKLKDTEADHSFLNDLEELRARFELKEREHADLLDEMRELNEALKARGDVISRQQEQHQTLVAEMNKTTMKLQQIEATLNEKEKSIAVKDEQVRDITKIADIANSKVSELQEKCVKNAEQVRVLTEEIQCIRNVDHNASFADAQSDVMSTSTISRADELNRMRDVEESFEEKYNKLRTLAVKLKKKLQEQNGYIIELENQVSDSKTLRAELEESSKSLKDLQNEHEQSRKKIENLKTENQKLKSSRKQSSVLNLEIEAAEKSLNEVSAKLIAKTNELEEQAEALKLRENNIIQLRKEIAILESAKKSECEHSRELKDQIDHLQIQIKDAVHSKQSSLIALKELEQTHESLKLELEEVRLQLAGVTSKHEAELATVQREKDLLVEHLQKSENTLRDSQIHLKNTEHALEDMRVEYLEYKVKAQAVLRKNQSKDTNKERELEEELLTLRASEKHLQSNERTHLKRIEECEKEIEMLKEDNDTVQRRSKELLQVIEELREQNENLSQENRIQLQKQQESFRTQRQQIENLDACHQKQIKEVEQSYQRQIEQLKQELSKVKRMPTMIGATVKSSNNLVPVTSHLDEKQKIEFLLMEREDAEGSEEATESLNTLAASRKISNASRRSQHDFMPLDELLNVPMNSISDTVTVFPVNSFGRQSSSVSDPEDPLESAQLELHTTKELLQKQESRVRHLTTLLAENEQDLAKLTQMNDMLKEELRRQERGVEREKHMHNSEYLKNVILKFITLNNNDERIRLVPVLNTILKLTRNETEMLNCVAKGQKVTTDSPSRGWTNFLTTWSGGGNNNNSS